MSKLSFLKFYETSKVGANSACTLGATADSCFDQIGPRQGIVALGGPATSTEDIRHQIKRGVLIKAPYKNSQNFVPNCSVYCVVLYAVAFVLYAYFL
jgi:hypothetical protein